MPKAKQVAVKTTAGAKELRSPTSGESEVPAAINTQRARRPMAGRFGVAPRAKGATAHTCTRVPARAVLLSLATTSLVSWPKN